MPGGRHQIGTPAGFKSESVAGFLLECPAGFIGIRIQGRLPRGYGLKRLIDLPLAWPDQWRTLGLETPARA